MNVTPRRAARPDLVISSVLFAVFAGALLLTLSWPAPVALLPRLVGAVGVTATGWLVLRNILALRASRTTEALDHADAAATEYGAAAEIDARQEHEPEYVFASATRAAWVRSIGFVAGFLIALWLFGIFVASGIFAFVYLRFVGARSWLVSLLYAAVLVGVLWALMRWVMFIPSPVGLILPGG